MRRESFLRGESGNSLIEFTFVGIPLIFVLMSTFEMSRAMWIYNTMAHAAKEGTRYAAMRGAAFKTSCVGTAEGIASPGLCSLDVQKIARKIADGGAGLVPEDVLDVRVITVRSDGTSVISEIPCGALSACLTSATAVPQSDLEASNFVRITMRYQFRSFFAMLWPGGGPGRVYTMPSLPASGQEMIQF